MENGEMKDLKNLFEEHKKVLKSLQDLLKEERDALLTDSVTELTAVIEKKGICAEDLERLENIRRDKYPDITQSYLEKIDEDEKVDSEGLTLLQDIKGQLRELEELSRMLRQDQDDNTLLIQQSMAYSNMMMQTIQDIVKKSGVYGKDGKMDQAPVQAGLDKSV